MSAKVRLSSKLPGEPEINGLDELSATLAEDPHQIICALVFLDVPKVTIDTETDAEIPTVRIRSIEPLGVVDKVPAAVREEYQRVKELRLGREPLPFGALDADLVYVSGGDDDE